MIICRKRFRGHGKQWPQDCIVLHPLPKPLLCSNNVVAEPKLLEQQLLLIWGLLTFWGGTVKATAKYGT